MREEGHFMHQESRQLQVPVLPIALALLWFVPYGLALSIATGFLSLAYAFGPKQYQSIGVAFFLFLFVLDVAALGRIVFMAVRALRGELPRRRFMTELLIFSLLLLFVNYGVGACALANTFVVDEF